MTPMFDRWSPPPWETKSEQNDDSPGEKRPCLCDPEDNEEWVADDYEEISPGFWEKPEKGTHPWWCLNNHEERNDSGEV